MRQITDRASCSWPIRDASGIFTATSLDYPDLSSIGRSLDEITGKLMEMIEDRMNM